MEPENQPFHQERYIWPNLHQLPSDPLIHHMEVMLTSPEKIPYELNNEVTNLKNLAFLDSMFKFRGVLNATVDGRNPAPPGMQKKPVNSGIKYLSLNWWTPDFSHQQYHSCTSRKQRFFPTCNKWHQDDDPIGSWGNFPNEEIRFFLGKPKVFLLLRVQYPRCSMYGISLLTNQCNGMSLVGFERCPPVVCCAKWTRISKRKPG